MTMQISSRLLFISCGAYFCWEAVPPLLVKGNGDEPEDGNDDEVGRREGGESHRRTGSRPKVEKEQR